MTDIIVPNKPVITRAENLKFFGLWTEISGTEDMSNIPAGSYVKIIVYNATHDVGVTAPSIPVESDGSWRFAQSPPVVAVGDEVYAVATIFSPGDQMGATSEPSDSVTVTGVE